MQNIAELLASRLIIEEAKGNIEAEIKKIDKTCSPFVYQKEIIRIR